MNVSPAIAAGFAMAAIFMSSGAGVFAQLDFSAPQPLNSYAAGDSGSDEQPGVATDGAGVVVAAWATGEFVSGTEPADRIFFARSADFGASWSQPAPLSFQAATPVNHNDRKVSLATDGNGNWVAVWSREEPFPDSTNTAAADQPEKLSHQTDQDSDILFAHSADNGLTWTKAKPLTGDFASERFFEFSPSIAIVNGVWVIVWATEEGVDGATGRPRQIKFSRSVDAGQTWSTPAFLIPQGLDTGDVLSPTVDADGAGTLVVAWERTDEFSDLSVSRSTDGGLTWSDPLTLAPANNTGPAVNPSLAGHDGKWVVVWQATAGAPFFQLLESHSTDGGATWSQPSLFSHNSREVIADAFSPTVATDNGRWVIVWPSFQFQGRVKGSDADLFVTVSDDAGATWSEIQILNDTAIDDEGSELNPALIPTGQGEWLAVWQSSDSLGGSIGTDSDILFARGEEGAQPTPTPTPSPTPTPTPPPNPSPTPTPTPGPEPTPIPEPTPNPEPTPTPEPTPAPGPDPTPTPPPNPDPTPTPDGSDQEPPLNSAQNWHFYE